jgi:sulfide:quinone oxidoreductase
MSNRVVVLGAGFGGLELSTQLSERMAGAVDVTLIDQADSFAFGFSKLDVMFGRATAEEVRLPYAEVVLPGVRVLQETVLEIDPQARTVTTGGGVHEADVLVIALGAAYDLAATPGFADADEFYSFEGARRLSEKIPRFSSGHALIGVCGAPFKCPPAPSECALMLDDDLRERGVREACEISFVMPMGTPVPPSPETSRALLAEFEERGIRFLASTCIAAVDAGRSVATLDDGTELAYDLFFGVPHHRAPDVVIASGMTEDGYVPVDPATLQTRMPGVYAIGDVATAGVPKAGVFAEGAARIVGQAIAADLGFGDPPGRHLGQGTCYIEFGSGRVASVDIDFLSGPEKTGTYNPPSIEQVARKEHFGSSRTERWFGRAPSRL